ncbi:Glycosyltransferase involved in cell wall bisynthesis [Jiangella alkaliphila]|uniref:Glycosyltransferase involved in cell wall bisynthesis n=2 Tax=Jiangella alkaliphila TaxID=419479 RepID=A0A1H2J247_9ACTN|nr:Glycosyltransferase involved in cell wall bisynthesis [Jiangella alkaliphila]
MERRRVLVQLDNLELGGAQINAVQLSAAVAEHGYDSLLIGPRDTLPAGGPSVLDVSAEYGVRAQAYDRPSSLLGHARVLTRHARGAKAQVVHAFSTSERAAYWGAGLLGRRALVRTIYEMSFDPRTHPSIPLVIGTGYLRDELAGRRGGTTLISPPVDMTRDAPGVTDRAAFRRGLGLPGDAVVLAIVSRLSEEMKAHGIEDAIDAVEWLGDPRVYLVVVGTGDAEARLRAIADGVNLRLGRTAVVFTGPLADPRPAYDGADVALGMGSSAARGLAFGKPLVVLGERGWSGVFRAPDTEAIFRSSFWSPREVAGGVELLTGHLRGLVGDAAERDRLGAAARAFAETNFGLDAMALRLAGVYDEALRTASSRQWLRDLGTERRILAAKLGRLTGRRVPGALEWKQRDADVATREPAPEGVVR